MHKDFKRVAQSTSELRSFVQTHTHIGGDKWKKVCLWSCDTLKYKFGTVFDLYLIFWVHCWHFQVDGPNTPGSDILNIGESTYIRFISGIGAWATFLKSISAVHQLPHSQRTPNTMKTHAETSAGGFCFLKWTGGQNSEHTFAE